MQLDLSIQGLSTEPVTQASAALLCPQFAASDPWKTLGYRSETLESYFTRPDPALARFALKGAHGWLGLLAVRSPWLRGPFIEFFGLLPEFQGQGHGSAVLRALEIHASAEGNQFVWVSATAGNVAAQRFYERAGYSEAFSLNGLIREGKDERFFQKRLVPAPA